MKGVGLVKQITAEVLGLLIWLFGPGVPVSGRKAAFYPSDAEGTLHLQNLFSAFRGTEEDLRVLALAVSRVTFI